VILHRGGVRHGVGKYLAVSANQGQPRVTQNPEFVDKVGELGGRGGVRLRLDNGVGSQIGLVQELVTQPVNIDTLNPLSEDNGE
jgi:hypothetical protein